MKLQSDGFGIEPELTAKIFKRGYRVYEVPITYDGRGYDEGKKIGWRDGVGAPWVLLRTDSASECSGRLLGTRPHRARLLAAVAAMVACGAASAALAAALIQPIFDEVLPNRENLVPIAAAILIVYLVKGVGAYSPAPHDRRRSTRRLRSSEPAVPTCPRAVRRRSRAADDRPAALASHQRRCAGSAGRVRDDGRSGARVAGARRLRGASVLLRSASGARVSDRRLARRVSARPSGPACMPHSETQPGGAGADVPRERRGDHRPPHRQGVRRRGREATKFERAPALLPNEHEGHELTIGAAATDGVHRRWRLLAPSCMARRKSALAGCRRGIHRVRGRAVHDVRAGQEAQSRECRSSAGDGGR